MPSICYFLQQVVQVNRCTIFIAKTQNYTTKKYLYFSDGEKVSEEEHSGDEEDFAKEEVSEQKDLGKGKRKRQKTKQKPRYCFL